MKRKERKAYLKSSFSYIVPFLLLSRFYWKKNEKLLRNSFSFRLFSPRIPFIIFFHLISQREIFLSVTIYIIRNVIQFSFFVLFVVVIISIVICVFVICSHRPKWNKNICININKYVKENPLVFCVFCISYFFCSRGHVRTLSKDHEYHMAHRTKYKFAYGNSTNEELCISKKLCKVTKLWAYDKLLIGCCAW